jgi:DNA replication protein DnaC
MSFSLYVVNGVGFDIFGDGLSHGGPVEVDTVGVVDDTVEDGVGESRFSKTGAELLFEVFSQRYERGSTLLTSNLPFDEWTEVFGSERLTGTLLDRLTHHVHILEMNGDSFRLNQSKKRRKSPKSI